MTRAIKRYWVPFLSIAVLCFGVFGAVNLSAQQGSRGGGQGRPTEEMLSACESKAAGDGCSFESSEQDEVSGTCFAPRNRPLACRPSGGPPGRRGGGQDGRGPDAGDQGDPIASTQAQTLGVRCSSEVNILNEQLGLKSEAKWSCSRGQRLLVANGVPNHATGTFPNANNPNRISAQTVSFATTLTPVARTGSGRPVKVPAYALNGIKFDPGTAGRCGSNVTDPAACDLGRGTGEWRIEALGQSSFDFGDDENHAHVQPSGEYHYHGIPEGMLTEQNIAGEAMQLIGWAADGFPVYARYGYADPKYSTSPLRAMKSSYQLKSTPDAGRPSAGVIPMGAFTQDYEYVAGSGDLDECNGRFGVTPDFPTGVYHYYATDTYPFLQRCVKGSVDSQPTAERRGEGRGERGQGRGRGNHPPRGGGRS
ncbi:YHYH protein [Parasphingorhabdus sp.]|uniref:YHYH protein n=1 Tax=Parasphingorhabdus sp. TaxID=2709688 RepID=UPI003BAFAE40